MAWNGRRATVFASKVARQTCKVVHSGNLVFFAKLQLVTLPWRSLFLMILQNDFRIEHLCRFCLWSHIQCTHTWIISPVLYRSLSCYIDDEVQITLQNIKWLSMKISLHYGVTNPVVINKMQHCEFSIALVMAIPQSCAWSCNEKGILSVKGMWNIFCCGTGDNKKCGTPFHWHWRCYSLALCDLSQIDFQWSEFQ